MLICTERLLLRPMTLADTAGLLAVYQGDGVTDYLRPMDAVSTCRQVGLFVAEWEQRGAGVCVVEDAVTAAFLGRSGLHFWPETGETEVGWTLRRECWGRGYAREAAAAVISWGFELGLARVVAYIRDGNSRSERVAAAVGMTKRDEFDVRGLHLQRFVKDRPVAARTGPAVTARAGSGPARNG